MTFFLKKIGHKYLCLGICSSRAHNLQAVAHNRTGMQAGLPHETFPEDKTDLEC